MKITKADIPRTEHETIPWQECEIFVHSGISMPCALHWKIKMKEISDVSHERHMEYPVWGKKRSFYEGVEVETDTEGDVDSPIKKWKTDGRVVSDLGKIRNYTFSDGIELEEKEDEASKRIKNSTRV